MEISEKEMRKIERSCRAQARDLVKEAYQKYDEVWTTRIRIDAQLMKHGKDVIADINKKMPNFLVRDQNYCSVDEVADMYGFESENELIEWLQAYTPRGLMESRLFEKLMDMALSNKGSEADENLAIAEYDEVPF